MKYEREFGPIGQSKTREIRISIQEFKNRPILNIRRWCEPYDGDEWRPTKQGIAFTVEHLPDLVAALQEAEAHARANGLIDYEPAARDAA